MFKIVVRSEGAAYAKPAQLTSPGRPWTVSLTVDIGTITFGWLELKRRLYNGHIPGPTITVRRGDVLTLNLVWTFTTLSRNHPGEIGI